MNLKTKLFLSIASLISALVLTVSPVSVFAYSGFGSGTSSSPYRISTCSQLEEMQNDLSGYYVLNNNINCNGTSFTSIAPSTAFTGNFNGENYTITDLNFTNCGLFCNISTGATIENVDVTGGTLNDTNGSSNYQGIIVGLSDGGTITNVHSNDTITLGSSAAADYVGGLVGNTFTGTTNINDSSFTGSITSSTNVSYVGGIVGTTYESVGTGNLTDDYSTADITLTSASNDVTAGGLNGYQGSGTTTDSYSAGNITVQSGATNAIIAGFDGLYGPGLNIVNSFSSESFTGANNAASFGSAIDTQEANAPGLYFNEYLAGSSSCNDGASFTCSGVNASNTQPDYFYTVANAPLSSWDFANTWSATSTYPVLQNVSAFNIPTPPNSGDLQNNGQLDEYEPNVVDVEDSNGAWASVSIPSGDGCVASNGSSVSASNLKTDFGYTTLTNPVDFNVYCTTTGASVPITIIYDREYSNPVLQFYNTNTGTYTTVSNAHYSVETIGGVQRTVVTYTATDGGAYDEDGTANGVIEDPVGLADISSTSSSKVGAPDTGYGAPGNVNFILVAIYIVSAVSISSGLFVLRRRKSVSKIL